ncbi:MAG: nuclear transport factor 2 family protein [Myxococcota bacterium]
MSQRDEIEAIQQLKYRYFRCLDTKDWEGLAELFVAEATSSYGDGKYSYEGREAIMEFLTESLGRDAIMTAHFGHHPEIELESDDRATGTWAFEDTVIDTQFEITIRGAGFYSDVYVKRGGDWKLLSTGYRRTFEEMESRKDRPGLRLTASRFAPIDET